MILLTEYTLNKRCHQKKLVNYKCDKCGILYRGNAAATGMVSTLMTCLCDNNSVEHITVFKTNLKDIWQNITEEEFPENTDTIAKKLVAEEILFESQRNDRLVMTGLKMKNKIHPE